MISNWVEFIKTGNISGWEDFRKTEPGFLPFLISSGNKKVKSQEWEIKNVKEENLSQKIMSLELQHDVPKPQDDYDKNVEKFYFEYVQPYTQ